MNILDEMGVQTMKPILLYGCIQSGAIYKNIEDNADMNSINILDETVEHAIFDTQHIFTSKPLDSADLTKICRYSVFTYDAKYILKDILKISQEDKDQLMNLDDNEADTNGPEDTNEHDEVLSIYFKEDGIQLWAIKTDGQFTKI